MINRTSIIIVTLLASLLFGCSKQPSAVSDSGRNRIDGANGANGTNGSNGGNGGNGADGVNGGSGGNGGAPDCAALQTPKTLPPEAARLALLT